MIKKALLAIALLAAIGGNLYVDHLQAQPTTNPPPFPVTEITLKVTPGELDLISEGLQTQPFGKVVPLINKLRQQVMEQQPKPVVPTVPINPPVPQP